MLLRAVPKGWFSRGFEVLDPRSGATVGRAELSSWRENAELEVAGARYRTTHAIGEKEFVLARDDGTRVLQAEKPSAWRERLSFEHDGARYELRKESAWRRAFALSREGVGEVGTLRPGGAFERGWTADLPEELPLEVRVFVMWLARVMWNRQDAAASGA